MAASFVTEDGVLQAAQGTLGKRFTVKEVFALFPQATYQSTSSCISRLRAKGMLRTVAEVQNGKSRYVLLSLTEAGRLHRVGVDRGKAVVPEQYADVEKAFALLEAHTRYWHRNFTITVPISGTWSPLPTHSQHTVTTRASAAI